MTIHLLNKNVYPDKRELLLSLCLQIRFRNPKILRPSQNSNFQSYQANF